jgi:hypothetical protein
VRRFTSSRAWAKPLGDSAEADHADTVTRRPEGGEPAPGMTTALITDEDGDLWQPLPSQQDPPRQAESILSVFVNLGAPLEEQEDARWHDLLEAMGFERQDQDAPVGFEDFDWSPIFPPDREHVARLLEPVVAKSGDIQEEINGMSYRATWPTS